MNGVKTKRQKLPVNYKKVGGGGVRQTNIWRVSSQNGLSAILEKLEGKVPSYNTK